MHSAGRKGQSQQKQKQAMKQQQNSPCFAVQKKLQIVLSNWLAIWLCSSFSWCQTVRGMHLYVVHIGLAKKEKEAAASILQEALHPTKNVFLDRGMEGNR